MSHHYFTKHPTHLKVKTVFGLKSAGIVCTGSEVSQSDPSEKLNTQVKEAF